MIERLPWTCRRQAPSPWLPLLSCLLLGAVNAAPAESSSDSARTSVLPPKESASLHRHCSAVIRPPSSDKLELCLHISFPEPIPEKPVQFVGNATPWRSWLEPEILGVRGTPVPEALEGYLATVTDRPVVFMSAKRHGGQRFEVVDLNEGDTARRMAAEVGQIVMFAGDSTSRQPSYCMQDAFPEVAVAALNLVHVVPFEEERDTLVELLTSTHQAIRKNATALSARRKLGKRMDVTIVAHPTWAHWDVHAPTLESPKYTPTMYEDNFRRFFEPMVETATRGRLLRKQGLRVKRMLFLDISPQHFPTTHGAFFTQSYARMHADKSQGNWCRGPLRPGSPQDQASQYWQEMVVGKASGLPMLLDFPLTNALCFTHRALSNLTTGDCTHTLSCVMSFMQQVALLLMIEAGPEWTVKHVD